MLHCVNAEERGGEVVLPSPALAAHLASLRIPDEVGLVFQAMADGGSDASRTVIPRGPVQP